MPRVARTGDLGQCPGRFGPRIWGGPVGYRKPGRAGATILGAPNGPDLRSRSPMSPVDWGGLVSYVSKLPGLILICCLPSALKDGREDRRPEDRRLEEVRQCRVGRYCVSHGRWDAPWAQWCWEPLWRSPPYFRPAPPYAPTQQAA